MNCLEKKLIAPSSEVYFRRATGCLPVTRKPGSPEAVTHVAETHVPDSVYNEASKSFSEAELANLTLAVAAINAWNRLAISARTTPGTYQPPQRASKTSN